MTPWHRRFRVELFLLAAVTLVALMVGTPHWPRAAAVLLPVVLGTALALRLTGRRRSTRLVLALGGLLLAAAAWEFVPTTTGHSRAGATAAVEALERLPAGDVEGYRAGRRQRDGALEAFPELKPRAREAEAAWLGRSLDQAVGEADSHLPDDPRAATARLRRANEELAQVDGFGAMKGRLRESRARAVRAALEAARGEALAVIARKKNDPDCMRAAAAIGQHLQDDFGKEAADLNITEVEIFAKGYAFLADLEEKANQKAGAAPHRSAVGGENSQVGKTVLTSKDGVRFHRKDDGGQPASERQLHGITYKVLREEGGRVWVRDRAEEGWLAEDDVVRLGDAVGYFTDRITANPNDAAMIVRRAVAWRLKGQLDSDIKDSEEAIRLDPKSAIAFNNRGNAWYAKKEYDRAIQDYDEAIKLDPGFAYPFYNRGNARSAKKEYDRAIQDYGDAIRLDPKNADAFYNRGNARSAKKEYDRAIQDYGDAIRLDPKYSLAFDNRGHAWFCKNEHDKAIQDFDEAIRLDPTNALTFNNRGMTLGAMKEYDRAIRDFNKALQIDPRCHLAYYNRGLVWFLKTEYDKALADFDRALGIDPTYASALNYHGLTWFRRGEYDWAIEDFDKAIRLDPTNASAFNHRGLAWSAKKEPDRAIKDYDDAIRLDPKYADAFNNRGNAWLGKKEYDRALQDLDKAIDLDPNVARAFNNRGIGRSAKKEYDRAIQDFNEAIRLQPAYALAFNNRGIAWHAKKEYGKAIQDFDEAIRLDPRLAVAFGNRAGALAKQKAYDRAVTDFEQGMKLEPVAWLQRGYALFRAACPEAKYRDGKKAIELASKAVERAGKAADWQFRVALAAAYAEAGDFRNAVGEQEKALTDRSLDKEDRAEMEKRLALYRGKKPYRAED